MVHFHHGNLLLDTLHGLHARGDVAAIREVFENKLRMFYDHHDYGHADASYRNIQDCARFAYEAGYSKLWWQCERDLRACSICLTPPV
jgi:hypothetical protein